MKNFNPPKKVQILSLGDQFQKQHKELYPGMVLYLVKKESTGPGMFWYHFQQFMSGENVPETFKAHSNGDIYIREEIIPFRNQLCKFVAPEGYEEKYPWKNGEIFLFLGEIVGMPGHCAVVRFADGVTHFSYHTENFEPTNEYED